MTDDRDNRRVFTPPAGVLAQIAAPVPESWEDQSSGGRASTAVVDKPSGSETPIQTMVRRSGETKNDVRQIDAKVDNLETRIESAHSKIEELYPILSDVRVEVASQAGQNALIIRMVDDLRQARERSGIMKLTSFTADVEVGKTRAITAIEDGKADRALRRTIIETAVTRIIAGLGIVFAAVVALVSRC